MLRIGPEGVRVAKRARAARAATERPASPRPEPHAAGSTQEKSLNVAVFGVLGALACLGLLSAFVVLLQLGRPAADRSSSAAKHQESDVALEAVRTAAQDVRHDPAHILRDAPEKPVSSKDGVRLSSGANARPSPNSLPAPSGQSSLTDAIDRVSRAVATVLVDHAQGSGFLVQRRRWLVTNFHVVQGSTWAKGVGKSVGSGEAFDIEVEGFAACDPHKDLVVLVLRQDWPAEPLALAMDEPRLGEDVFAVGTPNGLVETITRGIVSQVRTAGDVGDRSLAHRTRIIQTDVLFSEGSSGGPLCRVNGHVIGINSFGLRGSPDGVEFRFAIAAQELATLMERAGDSVRPLADLPRFRN